MSARLRPRKPQVGLVASAVSLLLLAESASLVGQQRPASEGEGFRFRSGIELVNVTATVSDASGRFVSGLTEDDFLVYDDGEEQPIAHFSAERVPVSLGIAIDTSGSMAGDKIRSARAALERFLFELLDAQDEVFLYRFSEQPDLVQGWTTDRRRLGRALSYLSPRGGTALYDTVAEALPLAQTGSQRRKALVVISDGADTNSMIGPRELRQIVRETEVTVYAVGIDGRSEGTWRTNAPRLPFPFPMPMPGRRGPWPGVPPIGGGSGGSSTSRRGSDASNIAALRELTGDSGGRTEVIRDGSDIDPATASIADELSKQYYIGYAAPHERDGRWHAIRVEVKNRNYRVRARSGYITGA